MYHVQYYPRCVLWGHEPLSRPTTSFARGCKLWSRERRYYEDERHSNMAQFSDRPYQWFQYPDLDKHYPGTWRAVHHDGKQLEKIVTRLVKPTVATTSRAHDIKEHITVFRLSLEQEKAKDIVFRTRSADPGQKSTGSSRHGSGSGFRQKNGKGGQPRQTCEETSWALTQMPVNPQSSALPQV